MLGDGGARPTGGGGGGSGAGMPVWSRVRDGRCFPEEAWRRGEPGLRLEIAYTAGMAELEKQCWGRSLFVNILGDGRATAADLLASLCLYCGIRQPTVTVEETFPPYQFFVRFSSDEDCARVLQLSSEVRCCNSRVDIRRWNRNARGRPGKLEYHTVLGIEGLPEKAQEPQTLNLVLAGVGGELIEILPESNRFVVTVAAWLRNPSSVPKRLVITVPAPSTPPMQQSFDERVDSPSPPGSPTEKHTEVYNLLLHVKEVIDRGRLLTEGPGFGSDDGEDLSRRHLFETWRGKVDGTGPGEHGPA